VMSGDGCVWSRARAVPIPLEMSMFSRCHE
jgi:hypothetical protein